MTIEEQVVNKLIDRGFHVSFAESCTGGLCSGTLVNVSNDSEDAAAMAANFSGVGFCSRPESPKMKVPL